MGVPGQAQPPLTPFDEGCLWLAPCPEVVARHGCSTHTIAANWGRFRLGRPVPRVEHRGLLGGRLFLLRDRAVAWGAAGTSRISSFLTLSQKILAGCQHVSVAPLAGPPAPYPAGPLAETLWPAVAAPAPVPAVSWPNPWATETICKQFARRR